jgi:predicted small metal-binding protein
VATRRAAPSTTQSRVTDQEDDMRAIDCPCGHHLEGADDDELFTEAREHVDRDHPEMQRSDEDIRARVTADAYDAQPVA